MGRTNKIPRTDSGWAWVVDCGAFIAYFTSIGYVSSLSVYLTIWMDYFEASATTVGLVVSMGILMRGLMSPLSGALCTKLGPRVVTMVGGVIFVTGAVLSSLSPTIGFLIVSNGLTASGGSMLYVAEVQALGMYFKKRFAFAVGLASAGISTGQLAFPPLVTYLIEVYGWHGSMLITAAINMHIVAAGALMRPMVRGKTTKKRRAHSVTKQNPGKNETCSTDETDPEDTMAGR
ncbi:monocarboxylate transporter 13-like, partial [Acanthaster planci]|uniref:Monocarboxylate transporter 13-like n=1 Tax=Acanthaster planci TaxID=133434 RepID=A0A8B7ZTN5_ACAPL